jgi:hypothetical protein
MKSTNLRLLASNYNKRSISIATPRCSGSFLLPLMSDKPTPIKDALAPFSGAADTLTDSNPPDFILRSSDGVDFHVHREILKFASDCFDGMFSVAGGDGDPTALLRDGKPILVLPEP